MIQILKEWVTNFIKQNKEIVLDGEKLNDRIAKLDMTQEEFCEKFTLNSQDEAETFIMHIVSILLRINIELISISDSPEVYLI